MYSRGGGMYNRGGGMYSRGGGVYSHDGGMYSRGGGMYNRGGGVTAVVVVCTSVMVVCTVVVVVCTDGRADMDVSDIFNNTRKITQNTYILSLTGLCLFSVYICLGAASTFMLQLLERKLNTDSQYEVLFEQRIISGSYYTSAGV